MFQSIFEFRTVNTTQSKFNKMVKSKKNNLHLEVSNDVDLEYETATTTSRRMKKGKGKGKTLTKTKKISLKAKPKKSGSFIIVNGKRIPLNRSNKSRRNKMTSKTRGAKKASSADKKRTASSSKSAKRMVLQRKTPKKAIKRTAKVSSALVKKRATSSKTNKGKSLQKKAHRLSNSSKVLKTKKPAPAKKIMPSLNDIKNFFGIKDKAQRKSRLPSRSASTSAKKLMPSSSSSDRKKKVSFEVKKKAQDSNSLQSSSTGSENSGSKTIYMPIKQEANGQTAEAIVVEDKEKADLQNVKLVVKAEKKN